MRRSKGEGSIRKRKDGRWEGRYTAGHDESTGKPIYKNVLGKTRQEAADKLRTAIQKSSALNITRRQEYTLAEWLELWYDIYVRPRLRPATQHFYTNIIHNHIIPNIGDRPIGKLKTIDIQKFFNDMLDHGCVQSYGERSCTGQPLSVRMVQGIRMVLNNAMQQAVEEGMILRNPVGKTKLPKWERPEMQVLEEDEIKAFLKEADNRGMLALF